MIGLTSSGVYVAQVKRLTFPFPRFSPLAQ
jgi:hypothetical protein